MNRPPRWSSAPGGLHPRRGGGAVDRYLAGSPSSKQIRSFNAVYPQLVDLDLATQATTLQVPVCFFVGRDDVNARAPLVEDYQRLSAPHKQLIWLNGGHGLGSADASQFLDVMINQVRRQHT